MVFWISVTPDGNRWSVYHYYTHPSDESLFCLLCQRLFNVCSDSLTYFFGCTKLELASLGWPPTWTSTDIKAPKLHVYAKQWMYLLSINMNTFSLQIIMPLTNATGLSRLDQLLHVYTVHCVRYSTSDITSSTYIVYDGRHGLAENCRFHTIRNLH